MNWLLITICAIIIVCGAVGYCKGLIRMAFSILAVVIAAILTGMLTPTISNALYQNESIYGGVYNIVQRNITMSELEAELNETDVEGVDIKKYAQETVDKLNLPDSIKDNIMDKVDISDDPKATLEEVNKSICTCITRMIINALVYVVVFVLVTIIIRALFKTMNLIGRMPIIRELNKMTGMIGGLALGVAVTYIFFAVIIIFTNTPFGSSAMECIENSEILGWLYDTNPIWNWIK